MPESPMPPHPPPAPPRRRPASVEAFKEMIGGGATPPPPPPLPAVQLRPTDVVIATYPKCGTTWTQQIVHGLRTRGSMDFEEISLVVPWMETAPLLGIDLNAPQVAEPRAFKTHLSWEQVPKGGRYIYVAREPGDALVSFYHFLNGYLFERDSIDLESFGRELFLSDFFSRVQFGRYWSHVRSWWEQRHREDVLFLCFEDLKSSLESVVRRIAAFTGIAADAELLSLVLRQSSFEFMRAHEHQFDEHPTTAAFTRMRGLPPGSRTTKVRTGRVGDSASLSPGVRATLDELWKREMEAPLGLRSYEELRARVREHGRGA